MHVRFTENALQDIKNIRDYLEDINPSATEKVIDRIKQITFLLSKFPLLGRKGLVEGTREFYVPKTSYIIIYSIPDKYHIDIDNIIHISHQWP
jgi:toxin ParE1/3/4